jgi:hypothetical protein
MQFLVAFTFRIHTAIIANIGRDVLVFLLILITWIIAGKSQHTTAPITDHVLDISIIAGCGVAVAVAAAFSSCGGDGGAGAGVKDRGQRRSRARGGGGGGGGGGGFCGSCSIITVSWCGYGSGGDTANIVVINVAGGGGDSGSLKSGGGDCVIGI